MKTPKVLSTKPVFNSNEPSEVFKEFFGYDLLELKFKYVDVFITGDHDDYVRFRLPNQIIEVNCYGVDYVSNNDNSTRNYIKFDRVIESNNVNSFLRLAAMIIVEGSYEFY